MGLRYCCKAVRLLSIFFILVSTVNAQQTIENRLNEIENMIAQLRMEKYDLICPNNFREALKKFEKANKDFRSGKNINQILKSLEEAQKFIREIKELGKQGKLLFQDALQARSDALTVRAPEFAGKEFEEAEKKLQQAGKRLEKGDLNEARNEGAKAERKFREAEFISIKETIVGRVKELLEKAEEQKVSEYAPYTIRESRNAYVSVLKLLEKDRYSQDEAISLTKEAEYQALHAVYLASIIKKLKKDEKNWELLIREFEDRLNNISAALGFEGKFDEGFSETEENIIMAINNLKKENKILKTEIERYSHENDSLSKRIKEFERTVLSELEYKKELEKKIHRIENLFDEGEAQVLLSGNKIIFRLFALTFQSGESFILPEHFLLLTKVMQALREFPNSRIEVAGHTDALGDDAYNFQLSERRAMAVRSYLLANMNIQPDQIQSRGYGETRPIASNESPEGRQLNRRIEIILNLKDSQFPE